MKERPWQEPALFRHWHFVVLLLAAHATCCFHRCCYCSAYTLTVQFDGSLRYPRDFGHPTSSLARMTACAACLLLETTNSTGSSPDFYRSRVVVQLGGKLLQSVSSTTSSGEVEYEALLFALQGLLSYLRELKVEAADDNHGHLQIVVQGDCKTVLDQMNGISHPRKLVDYHRRAQVLLECVKDALPATGIAAATAATNDCRIQFQHVPRGENLLCDRLSACIVWDHQEMVYQRLCCELEGLSNPPVRYHTTGTAAKSTVKNTTSKRPSLVGILQAYFAPGTSVVALSRRPILYRVMARLAAQAADFATLLQIATLYHDDVQACQRQSSSKESLGSAPSSALSKRPLESPSTHSTTDDLAYMMSEAILFQIIAWERMKKPKKADALRRKYAWQLQQWNCDPISAQLWQPMPNVTYAHGAGGGGDDITEPGGHATPPDWPPLVRQWLDLAPTSSIWKETRSYWSPIDRV
jgi:ribonuclease HI